MSETSLHAVMYAGGFSGTETAVFEHAMRLAAKGHEVYVLGPTTQPVRAEGVVILPWTQEAWNSIPFDELDVFSPLFYSWFHEVHAILRQINPARTKVWLWYHSVIEPNFVIGLMKGGYRVFMHFLSDFTCNLYKPLLQHPNVESVVIGNGIHEIFTGPLLQPHIKQGTWIFHATFTRGGEMCKDIFKRVQSVLPMSARELHIASYYTPDHTQQAKEESSSILWHGSLPKVVLRSWLDRADYFVYMLVNEKGEVHHDTYACCVLEAMARGVIVISWDVACLKEIYGDHIVLLPIDEQGYDARDAVGHCKALWEKQEYKERVVKAILELESNKERKEELRTRAASWAHQQLWQARVDALEPFLQSSRGVKNLYIQ